MILLFLTSGLFLGWSLGANDASNIFGSAVASKMLSFRRAALIASAGVILGAVFQGSGTSETLGKLGAVNAIGGSFTVSLAAAITIYVMTKFALPVSTTQAIVGAIIGWNLFTGNPTDLSILEKIILTWIISPVLGALFAILMYILLKRIKNRIDIHLIRFESHIRTGLIFAGAFGAYSLGANNIANVMGVFLPSINLEPIDAGIFSLSSAQQLFLLGGLAIATGIITYSKKVMETIGSNIFELSAEAALIVVLAQSLVLFIFSSSGLSDILVATGLPPVPMVPVSSSQVIVGCVLGIGIYKGVGNINFKLLGEIGMGWIATPLASGFLAFISLFFIRNIFGINVGVKTGNISSVNSMTEVSGVSNLGDASGIMRYLLIGIFAALTISAVLYFLFERKKKKELLKSEELFWKYLK